MKFLACCVLPDKKLYGSCLYWLNILYWKFFHLSLKNRVCPENFRCIEYTFTFRTFEELALLPWIHCILYTFLNIQDFWATCACTVLKYFLSFRIFEQLVLALNNRACPEFFHCIEYIFFYHSRILNNLRLLWKTEIPLKFFTVLKYFLPFRIFEQLALALKTEFALNIFKTGEAAATPDPPSRAPTRLTL